MSVTVLPKPEEIFGLCLGRPTPIAGEEHHIDELRQVIGSHPLPPALHFSRGLAAQAYLVREPDNRRGTHYTSVYLEHGTKILRAGHLPRVLAQKYQHALDTHLAKHPWARAFSPARLVRGARGLPRVLLNLGEHHACVIANPVPAVETFVVPERKYQVFPDGHDLSVVQSYADGPSGFFYVVVRQNGSVTAGMYRGEPILEITVDGQAIGRLANSVGAQYGSLIAGGPLVAQASLSLRHQELVGQVWLPTPTD